MDNHNAVIMALRAKFGNHSLPDAVDQDLSPLIHLANRGSCRDFESALIPREVIEFLCATALASPTKSDLQQRDIVIVENPKLKYELLSLVSNQCWTKGVPHLLIFCGNNRRLRLLHEWNRLEFANDHLDAFFNAVADAAIALAAFVNAAEALEFGCCPISAVRDHAQKVSNLLNLPNHVFPFAGLALGYPIGGSRQNSLRLPLSVTVHTDRYAEDNLEDRVRNYDDRRQREQPYKKQRLSEQYGESETYGWSLDKARQYSVGERTGFGDFILAKGFKL